MTTRHIIELSAKILCKDISSPPFNFCFHYHSVIGKTNFLGKSTRPEISYTNHQCDKLSEETQASHDAAIKHLDKYIANTIC